MVLAAFVGYLIGSFPSAQLVGRLFQVDPTRSGDGNPGWWNMRQLVGKRRALLVLALDVIKGMLAAMLAGALTWGEWWWVYVGIGGAMVGHAFPIFAHFVGGRSVLVFVGAMLVVSPVATLLALAVGALVGVIKWRLDYGARVAMASFPLLLALFVPRAEVATVGLLMTFIGLRFLTARRLAPASSAPASMSPE